MKRTIFLLLILSTLNIFSQDNCNITVSGVISNLKSGSPVEEVVVNLYKQGEDTPINSVTTDAEGNYSFQVECKKRYILEARKENFTESRKIIYPAVGKAEDKTIDIKLYPINEFFYRDGNKLIDVGHVGFETDGSELTPFIKEKLDMVVNVMKKYPKIRISVDVHTDSKGDPEYSMKISKERADTVVAYLIEQGVDAERLEGNGYGDTQLLNHCAKGVDCTELQHKENRRIDFVVIP